MRHPIFSYHASEIATKTPFECANNEPNSCSRDRMGHQLIDIRLQDLYPHALVGAAFPKEN